MKTKYKRGRKIVSVGDYEKSPAALFCVRFGMDERTKHRGFLDSWQYHTLHSYIHRGWIYEAELIKENKSESEE